MESLLAEFNDRIEESPLERYAFPGGKGIFDASHGGTFFGT